MLSGYNSNIIQFKKKVDISNRDMSKSTDLYIYQRQLKDLTTVSFWILPPSIKVHCVRDNDV